MQPSAASGSVGVSARASDADGGQGAARLVGEGAQGAGDIGKAVERVVNPEIAAARAIERIIAGVERGSASSGQSHKIAIHSVVIHPPEAHQRAIHKNVDRKMLNGLPDRLPMHVFAMPVLFNPARAPIYVLLEFVTTLLPASSPTQVLDPPVVSASPA